MFIRSRELQPASVEFEPQQRTVDPLLRVVRNPGHKLP